LLIASEAASSEAFTIREPDDILAIELEDAFELMFKYRWAVNAVVLVDTEIMAFSFCYMHGLYDPAYVARGTAHRNRQCPAEKDARPMPKLPFR
jgi:hypothetical protein